MIIVLDIKVQQPTKELLTEYGEVSIAFYVESEYRVIPNDSGLKGLQLVEVEPEYPYWVDHGLGELPEMWWVKWDLTNWIIISAYKDGKRVGGGIVAFDTAGVDLLGGRKDLALLWDLRVDEQWRGHGIGSKIFAACVEWSKERGCKYLKIETQTYNIAACKFYAKQGAVLGMIDTQAYPHQPRIKQLIWYLDL